ncbi:MAG: lysophospholipid acyltransferase family protein [Mycobacteriales bacterium]
MTTTKPWLVRLIRAVGGAMARCLFAIRIEGAHLVPASGPVLLAGNHSGFVDGPLVFLLAPRPAALLAKAEIFIAPFNRLFLALGQIPVHRGKPDRTALKSGLAHLAAGNALGVFPEGTRGSGAFEEITDGLAYLALRSGAPVVPLAVIGTAKAWPKGNRPPKFRAPVHIVFGAPVMVTATGDPRARRTVADAAEQLRLALFEHVQCATRETA